jgi:uncharacterized protein with GYD domain
MLATGALGKVTTQTMKGFTEGEYRKIVGSLYSLLRART